VVEGHFEAKEWLQLPPQERARKCRLMAAEAAVQAMDGPAALRSIFSDLTHQWAMLADEIGAERSL
jgi:hypothetical protein